jgi:hypothetical protein
VVARSLPRRLCASGILFPERQGTRPQSGAENFALQCYLAFDLQNFATKLIGITRLV